MAAKRYETIEDLENNFILRKRTINSCNINYKGFKTDKYTVLKPVSYFSEKSQSGTGGWIVQNNDDKTYSILPNVTVVRAYNDVYAIESYFGIRYSPAEGPFEVSRELVEKQMRAQVSQNGLDEDKFDTSLIDSLIAYDNNINYFGTLSHDDFERSLQQIIDHFGFREIHDANGIKNCLYILVLDKYKQFYVGSAASLANRTKKHWNAIMNIHRFCWVGGPRCKLNIDTFRMKDTTRIFVCENISKLLKDYRGCDNRNLEKTNTFGIYKYPEMSELERAERIVINHSSCKYCMSDRIPLDATEGTIGEWNCKWDNFNWNDNNNINWDDERASFCSKNGIDLKTVIPPKTTKEENEKNDSSIGITIAIVVGLVIFVGVIIGIIAMV